jgi:hypothetical protein
MLLGMGVGRGHVRKRYFVHKLPAACERCGLEGRATRSESRGSAYFAGECEDGPGVGLGRSRKARAKVPSPTQMCTTSVQCSVYLELVSI